MSSTRHPMPALTSTGAEAFGTTSLSGSTRGCTRTGSSPKGFSLLMIFSCSNSQQFRSSQSLVVTTGPSGHSPGASVLNVVSGRLRLFWSVTVADCSVPSKPGPLGFSVTPFSAPWRAHLMEQNTERSACDSDVSVPAHSFSPPASILANTVSPVNSDALPWRNDPQSLFLISENPSHLMQVRPSQSAVLAALGGVSSAGSNHGHL